MESPAKYLIESSRLKMRPLLIDDIDMIAPILADPIVTRYIGGPLNPDEAEIQLKHWIEDQRRDGFGFMALIEKSRNHLIGYGGFIPQVIEGKNFVELGYVIHREHWGCGYATEAALALRDYGFNLIHLKELISIIHADNPSSLHVAEKIGMTLLKSSQIDNSPCLIYHIAVPLRNGKTCPANDASG